MGTRELRQLVRNCQSKKELYELLLKISENYRFYMKTHGSVFPLDAINIGENIRCLFPIMWVRHYKKIKKFSYMIQIKPRKGYNDSTDITYIEMQ
jgi:hypothetical protein